jgi:uncharacterized protein DUF6259
LARPDPTFGHGAVFRDRGARLVIQTDLYRLALAKTNGAVLSLIDRTSGKRLLQGQSGCLWGARISGDATYVGGCAFRPRGSERFSYRWDRRSGTLNLRYGVEATVTIRADSALLDLRLSLANTRERAIENVLFPADLRADATTVAAGYAPNFLPGVRFRPAFFGRVGSNAATYPSRWAFADYLALDLGKSHLSVYSVNPPPAAIAPVTLGFVHTAEGDCASRAFCLVHSFETWVEKGQTWTSPVVRVRVGETARESMLSYRRDNGIEAYPSLSDKLGARLATLARAPLIKADLWKGLRPFSEWTADLARLPSPAVLHPVAYQPGGHDESDPDFLPPDPRWGTLESMRATFTEARSRELLLMPYLNASWWDVDSPTLKQLPAARELAVQGPGGEPLVENYGDHSGYVVSPYVPFVKQRIARIFEEWRSDVPADCLFFDQIGARPWVRDHNPASPSPLAYDDGWLAVMAPYRDRCLMVEDGWDRLADSFVGFHGGLLLMERERNEPNRDWGTGNWEPYPLAVWLLHDKVLLYQHDLYEGTMTTDLEVLTWNLAFGFQLSYAWNGWTQSLDSPWLSVAGSFQRVLGPLYAGRALTRYAEPMPGVAISEFGDYTVVSNRNAAVHEVDGHGIAAGGFLARGPGIVAGAFSGTFAGASLSAGTHYLLVERSGDAVTVQQPLGGDTSLAIDSPSPTTPHATAHAADGRTLGEARGELRGGRFVFDYRATVDGTDAAFYRIR